MNFFESGDLYFHKPSFGPLCSNFDLRMRPNHQLKRAVRAGGIFVQLCFVPFLVTSFCFFLIFVRIIKLYSINSKYKYRDDDISGKTLPPYKHLPLRPSPTSHISVTTFHTKYPNLLLKFRSPSTAKIRGCRSRWCRRYCLYRPCVYIIPIAIVPHHLRPCDLVTHHHRLLLESVPLIC